MPIRKEDADKLIADLESKGVALYESNKGNIRKGTLVLHKHYLDKAEQDKIEELTLPEGLLRLEIKGTTLSKVPKLPTSLQHFECIDNEMLTALPELPKSLKVFRCNRNAKLTKLPRLPDSLKELECAGNPMLGRLPELPKSLKVLKCRHNKELKTLPRLPNSLTKLVLYEPGLEEAFSDLITDDIKGYGKENLPLPEGMLEEVKSKIDAHYDKKEGSSAHAVSGLRRRRHGAASTSPSPVRGPPPNESKKTRGGARRTRRRRMTRKRRT